MQRVDVIAALVRRTEFLMANRVLGGFVRREVAVRPLESAAARAEAAQARRETWHGLGVRMNDEAVELLKQHYGHQIGVFVDGRLAGAVSWWSLARAPLSLGYLLSGVDIGRYNASRCVELAGLFLRPEYRGMRLAKRLVEAAIIALNAQQVELMVAFAVVPHVVALYREFLGFRVVSPAITYPWANEIQVQALVLEREGFVRLHCR